MPCSTVMVSVYKIFGGDFIFINFKTIFPLALDANSALLNILRAPNGHYH